MCFFAGEQQTGQLPADGVTMGLYPQVPDLVDLLLDVLFFCEPGRCDLFCAH